MTEFVIEAKGLGKKFGKITVLNALDLSVSRGMVVGLLGTKEARQNKLTTL
jgi:ABC-type multidrug transport system ATPase subunit